MVVWVRGCAYRELLLPYQILPCKDMTLTDQFGGVALHIAAAAGHVPIANLLVNRGADINVRHAKEK